jgi:hypothetical protein
VHIAVGTSAEGTETPREKHVLIEMAVLMLLAVIRKASRGCTVCMLCAKSAVMQAPVQMPRKQHKSSTC